MENNVKYCECEWCGRLVICREIDGQMLCDRCFAEYKSETKKEQESKPVKVVKTESDYKLYYCPRCNRPFCDFYYVKPKFCDKCGQAVKWNDRYNRET